MGVALAIWVWLTFNFICRATMTGMWGKLSIVTTIGPSSPKILSMGWRTHTIILVGWSELPLTGHITRTYVCLHRGVVYYQAFLYVYIVKM